MSLKPSPINTTIRFAEKRQPANVPISPADTIASGFSSITTYYIPAKSEKSSSPSSTRTVSHLQSKSQSQPKEAFPLPSPSTKFCLALYPYTDPDPTALSFSRGEVIEIISQHSSGWWDGMAGGSWNGYGLSGNVRRGWVPSNYVRMLSSREEARRAMTESQKSNSRYL